MKVSSGPRRPPAEEAILVQLVERSRARGLVLDLVDEQPDDRRCWRCRTYRLHLEPALWGGIDVVRGRRGSLRRPRRLVTHHADDAEAVVELQRVIRRRLRHGYSPAPARRSGGGRVD